MKIAVVTGLALAAAAPAAAQNIVTNGDFQTGDLTGWTTNNGAWFATNTSGYPAGNPSPSNYFASTGCVGDGCVHDNTGAVNGTAFLYQDLATTAGTYTLSFDFGSAGTPMELAILFGGVNVFDRTDLPIAITTYTVTGLTATGGTTRLEFFGRQDPSFDFLDNVSVVRTGVTAVAEPAAWALMIVGFGAVGATLRRRSARIAFAA